MNRRHALGLVAAGASLPAFALYDPKPDAVLALVLGEWRGTFVYRDGGPADREITLPARLVVSMNAPDEIALYYAYDESAGKTDYSYERMRFEFASGTLLWIYGAVDKRALLGRIVSANADGDTKRFVVDTRMDRTLSRYTIELGPKAFNLQKDEIDSAGAAVRRNRHAFTRA
jgi:hypothetical protein